MKSRSLLILVFLIVAIMALRESTTSASSPQLLWFTCVSCPNAPEVSVSGDTITMGVANRLETAGQPRSYHGAASLLAPANQYIITFDYDLYSWDSYSPRTELGKGYWDSFSISVSSQPLWQTTLSDPLTPNNLPGLGLIWGGAKWGDHILKHVSGRRTVIVQGSPTENNYLSVVLDTASVPDSDSAYPSWGTITIRNVDSDGNLGNIRNQAANIARTVVGGQYLWNGKGWNWTTPKEYVSAQKVVSDGYYYHRAEEPHIVLGRGLDCSGLVYWAYNRAAGTTVYPGYPISQESAQGQYDSNTTPIDESDLQPGDLLFFSDSATGPSITHVAMYVGGSDPNRNVVEAANPSVGIVFSSKDQRSDDPEFRGYGRVKLNQIPLIIQTHSPVTLIVTDPEGYTIASDTFTFTGQEFVRGIPGVLYYTTDQNGDDIIYAPVLKPGVYTIQVVPKQDANPSDTFGLEAIGSARLIDLAADTPISEIPPEGYRITAGDGEINPTALKVFLPFVLNNYHDVVPTATPTTYPSLTPSATIHPTITAMPSLTPTAGPSNTPMATGTAVGTPEATNTPQPTSTHTPAPTGTSTPTATPTFTPTPTLTPTFTSTPTATPTNTPLPPPPGPTILLGPSTNNGGFESGTMSGWTMLNGFVDVNGDFVHSGSYSVHGTSAGDESGGQPPVIFYRDISLEPYRLWIDAGLGVADYEAWLHNGNSEYYRFIVRFFNSSGTNLATYDTGWIRDTGGGYHQHGEQRNIPVGTSYVRVEAQMKRYAGSYTDVDIDDMTFRIQFNNP